MFFRDIALILSAAALTGSAAGCTSSKAPTEPGAKGAAAGPPTVETVATFPVRPGNLSVTPAGRILITNSPLAGPSVKLAELTPQGDQRPYPSAALAEGKEATIQGAIGIRTTDQGMTWVLDMPTHTFYGIEEETREVAKRWTLPDDVLTPTSFLQDFALDQKRKRAIIADMTQGDLKSAPTPAFIVVDLETGKAQRVAESHPSMMPEIEGGFALNPITIDPKYEYVYFGALNGRTLYRVPAAAFDGDGASVANSIERYGPKSFCDGITVDGAGHVYVTDVESKGYGVTTPDGYRLIAKLPEDQSWPDGLSFGVDGYIYGTVDQLDRTAALAGKESGTGAYLIVRFRPLAPGARGR
ncbi:MAG: hypothetical protein AAFU79_05015 [Myxococcota bacterium]